MLEYDTELEKDFGRELGLCVNDESRTLFNVKCLALGEIVVCRAREATVSGVYSASLRK